MGFIDYEVDGQVGIITINRPKALNALNSEVLKDLDATIDAVDLDAIRKPIRRRAASAKKLVRVTRPRPPT